jgi:hypothetical protein
MKQGTLTLSAPTHQGSGSTYIANASNSNAILRVDSGPESRARASFASARHRFLRRAYLTAVSSAYPTTGDENFGLARQPKLVGYFNMTARRHQCPHELGGTAGRFGTASPASPGGTLRFSSISCRPHQRCAGVLTMEAAPSPQAHRRNNSLRTAAAAANSTSPARDRQHCRNGASAKAASSPHTWPQAVNLWAAAHREQTPTMARPLGELQRRTLRRARSVDALLDTIPRGPVNGPLESSQAASVSSTRQEEYRYRRPLRPGGDGGASFSSPAGGGYIGETFGSLSAAEAKAPTLWPTWSTTQRHIQIAATVINPAGTHPRALRHLQRRRHDQQAVACGVAWRHRQRRPLQSGERVLTLAAANTYTGATP